MNFFTILKFVFFINLANLISSENIIAARVFHGIPMESTELPWQVYISSAPQFGIAESIHCGGSLITSNAILTSANCVDGFERLIIQFGSLRDDPISVQHVNRSNVIIYPRYNASNFNNDIAIVRLKHDIYFNEHIQPVLLPKKSQAVANHFNGTTGRVAGWGYTSDDAGATLPTILQFAQVRIISNDECATSVHKSLLVASTICSFGLHDQRSSPCVGDEGGPLVVYENNSWVQIAVVSFTHTKCSASTPTGYTGTAFFVDWISRITGLPVRI